MSELWQLSATEAVGKLRRREVSPLEIVDAAIARIEEVEPKVIALPIQFFDVARTQAKALRARATATPGGWPGCRSR
jgi:amidase